MSVSRRKFMRSGALTALSAGLLLKSPNLAFGQKLRQSKLGADNPIPYNAQKELLYIATRGTFEPYIGSIFQARGANGDQVELTLVSVTPYKQGLKSRVTTGKPRATDSFSLLFRATGPLPSFSSIPSLYHPALGRLDLFLTPHQREGGELFYEAVFNHV